MSDSTRQSRRRGPRSTGARLQRSVCARLRAVPAIPLWGVTVAAVVGDLVSTVYGLELGLREQNPFVAGVIESHGVAGLVALKCLCLGWAVAAWVALERHYGVATLVGLAVPQGGAVVVNLLTILALLS